MRHHRHLRRVGNHENNRHNRTLSCNGFDDRPNPSGRLSLLAGVFRHRLPRLTGVSQGVIEPERASATVQN